MASDFEAQLRAVSLRLTRPRLAVLAALRDHPHVDCAVGHAPCLTASDDQGFVADEAEVV
jgi:hypothetical protein